MTTITLDGKETVVEGFHMNYDTCTNRMSGGFQIENGPQLHDSYDEMVFPIGREYITIHDCHIRECDNSFKPDSILVWYRFQGSAIIQ